MNFQVMGCRRFCNGCVYLCRGPVGESREGVCLEGTVRDSGRRAPETKHLSLWDLC